LLLPAIPMLIAFTRSQWTFALAHNGLHGYSISKGLLDPKFEPAALWGLGGHTFAVPHTPLKNVWGWVLSVPFVVGLVVLCRRRRWGQAAAAVVLLAGALDLLLLRHYPYASYKLISFGWWCVVAAVVEGCRWLIGLVPGRWTKPALGAGLAAGALLLAMDSRARVPMWGSPFARLPASAFRHVGPIKDRVGKGTLLLAADDWLTNEMALYYLRDVPLYVMCPRSWFQDPQLENYARFGDDVPPAGARYVLTDARAHAKSPFSQYGRRVVAAGPYQLWQLDPEASDASLVHSYSTCSLEPGSQGDVFWLGADGGVLYVLARRPGVLQLTAEYLPGKGGGEGLKRTVSVRVGDSGPATVTLEAGKGSLAVLAQAGLNKIVLRPLDPPTAPAGLGEEPPHLLGIRNLTVRQAPEGAEPGWTPEDDPSDLFVIGIENRNGLERTVEGKRFMWLGPHDTVLRLVARRPGVLELAADCVLGPSVVGTPRRRVRVSTDTGYCAELVLGAGPAAIPVPVQAGMNTVSLHALDRPTRPRLSNGDARPLVLGVRDLTLRFKSPSAPSAGSPGVD
jgi:hypothetical protein